jgi:hypothetical protein
VLAVYRNQRRRRGEMTKRYELETGGKEEGKKERSRERRTDIKINFRIERHISPLWI